MLFQTKNSNKIVANQKKLGMVLLVVRIYPKRKYQLFLSKSEEKQHKHDFTCQAPSNGILG